MIIKGVGGASKKASVEQKKASAKNRIMQTVIYVSKAKDGVPDAPIYTNCAGAHPDEIINEMESLKTLRPRVSDPVRHVVFSPEVGDRALTKEEWQKAIDIFRKEREFGGAPFVAYLHTDGHKDRHAHHVHLVFLRTRPDGSLVPDSLDAKVNFGAAREIEKQLGLIKNEGKMFSGRSKHDDRARQGEHQNVDPERVQHAISKAHNPSSLRAALREQGIDVRYRRRGENNDIYAWSLKNAGAKYWTAGSKLTPDNSFAWASVQTKLGQNAPLRWNGKRHGDWRKGNVSLPSHNPRQRRSDVQAQEQMADALSVVTETIAATRRSAKRVANRHQARQRQRG